MQLSWIDPDALRELAAKLHDATPPPVRPAPEPSYLSNFALDEEPIAPDLAAYVQPEEPLPVKREAISVTKPAAIPEPAPVKPPQPQPQLFHRPAPETQPRPVVAGGGLSDAHVARIRQQLLAIRSKAVQAGMLPPQEAKPAVPEASAESRASSSELPQSVLVAGAVPEVAVVEQSSVAAAVALATSSPTPEASRNVLESLPPIPSTTAPKEDGAASFLPLEGNLEERLASFAQWAQGRVPSDELLLVDDHGEVLWGSPSRSDLAFNALLSLNSAMRAASGGFGPPPPLIRSQLAADRELTVMPCTTCHGTVTLAMLNAKGLANNDTLDLLREGLVLSIEGRRP